MDILKYLCLNYSHVPSFVMSVSLVRTGGWRGGAGGRFCTRLRIHSYYTLCVLHVSVFLDREGLSNDAGQMSQIIQLVSSELLEAVFFLTLSVKLYRISNEVMYSCTSLDLQ